MQKMMHYNLVIWYRIKVTHKALFLVHSVTTATFRVWPIVMVVKGWLKDILF